MRDSCLIAIDAGVSFIKAGVYDAEGAKKAVVTKSARAEYPGPGLFIQRAEDQLDLVKEALKEAVAASGVRKGSVAAIAVSGAMGGAMGVDVNWSIAADWSIVADARFQPYAAMMQKAAGERILERSGTNLPVLGGKILWWKKEYPAQYGRVAKFMMLGGYLAGKLAGMRVEEAFIDRTYLSFTGIADLAKESWSEEICREFGIDMSMLPRIARSNEIVGKLCLETAIECGLLEGIPIVAGAGDKPAGTLGAGLVSPGLLIDESASFGALSLCVDRYVPDTGHRTLENLPSPIPGLYLPSVFLTGSGMTHAWFTEVFADGEKKAAAEGGRSVYELLDAKASTVAPGSEGLMALGLLGGRGYPSDSSIRGLWLGHSWVHKKEHFYRSLLESFAYEYGCALDVMRENYPDLAFEEIRVIGGGAKSALWSQIKADVMGVRYVALGREDFTLLGDILLAGSAVGVFGDLCADAKRFAERTRTFEPDKKKTDHYRRYTDIYRGLFERLRGVYTDLQGIPPFDPTL